MKNKYGPFANRIRKDAAAKTEEKDESSKTSKQQGFVEFIKAPAFLLAYLYLISICYHFGYWSDFGIDIFNFYSAQDLVKGATYGLSNTFSFLILFAIPYLVLYFLFTSSARKVLLLWIRAHKTYYIIINVLILLGYAAYYYYGIGDTEAYRNLTENIIHNIDNKLLPRGYGLTLIVFIFIYSAATLVRKHFSRTVDFKERIFNIFLYSFIITLPPVSYISGLDANLFIKRGVEFDYISNQKISKENLLYKYLGKASDHYFLSTIDGKKIIVIKIDSIQPLVISHFHANDSASSRLFLAAYNKASKISKPINGKQKSIKVKSDSINGLKKLKSKGIDSIETKKP